MNQYMPSEQSRFCVKSCNMPWGGGGGGVANGGFKPRNNLKVKLQKKGNFFYTVNNGSEVTVTIFLTV
jgi:hypothetical protein